MNIKIGTFYRVNADAKILVENNGNVFYRYAHELMEIDITDYNHDPLYIIPFALEINDNEHYSLTKYDTNHEVVSAFWSDLEGNFYKIKASDLSVI